MDTRLSPMLIGSEQPPFNDKDFIFELKLDGVRCLAYLYQDKTELINKRGVHLTGKFPELAMLHKQVKTNCILDGELYVFHENKTDFFEIQKRTLMSDRFRIRLLANQLPATFTAFDILYEKDTFTMQEPLMQRKKRLKKIVQENERFSISRFIEEQGIALFQQTSTKGLEGIVAKKKDSKYVPSKRTKEWIKCKHLLDDDFAVVGYIVKEKGIVSLVLAQYDQDMLVYKGHVTMGVSLPYLYKHTTRISNAPFLVIPKGNDDAIWITPHLVGTVKFMEYTKQGGLRQSVFKGFREDKESKGCLIKRI